MEGISCVNENVGSLEAFDEDAEDGDDLGADEVGDKDDTENEDAVNVL